MEDSLVIQSPGYPEAYAGNLDCVWNVNAK